MRRRPHRRPSRKPAAGSRPGTLVIAADSPEPIITVTDYNLERAGERGVQGAAGLTPFVKSTNVTWIDIQGFGNERLLREVAELFGLHPLSLADIVNVPQRPKFDHFGDYSLFICQMAHRGAHGHWEMEQVGVVLGSAFVLTFQERPGDIFDPVRQRIREGLGPLRGKGADYLAYALLDRIVDGYFPLLESLGETLQALEEEILERPQSLVLPRLHGARRQLAGLRRTAWSQRDALNAVLRQDDSPFTEEVRVYMRDVYDHAVQVMDMVDSSREMAVGLMDIYLSTISNRMNEIMKVLTIMASIFVPLTFIAGIYGMNFANMPELRLSWGYPAALMIMGLTAGGLLLYFRRRGWIGRRRSQDRNLPPAA